MDTFSIVSVVVAAVSLTVAVVSLLFAVISFNRAKRSTLELSKLKRDTQDIMGELKTGLSHVTVTWEQLGKGLDELRQTLTDRKERYIPDVILGISGGGLAIADMLSVRLRTYINIRLPVCGVDIRKEYRNSDRQPKETSDPELRELTTGKSVLLVEDFFWDGLSLTILIERIKQHQPKILRLFVFAVPERAIVEDDSPYLKDHLIDYYCTLYKGQNLEMPWGRV